MTKQTKERPILVPVDFSRHSEAALLIAADLAVCLEQPILVLHVVHDPGDMPGYYSRAFKKKKLHRIEDAAQEMLEEFLQRIVSEHPNLEKLRRLDPLLVKGLPTTRILEVAQKRNVLMIVLGSKGLTGIKHIVMGSVAERVVQAAKVPVTVVKAEP
jgi:nucleotide-binding universal stress UspA family protein